jgi:hypothetical protein
MIAGFEKRRIWIFDCHQGIGTCRMSVSVQELQETRTPTEGLPQYLGTSQSEHLDDSRALD